MRIDRFTKSVVLLNCSVPAALLAWDAWAGRLGANPVNFAIRTTGVLSLVFLVLSLAVTPAARLSGWGWLGQFRRTLGLYAFFHTGLHFLLFFWLDRSGSVADTASEVWMRPYLMVGTVGLVLMAPLAATSTDRMIKRLGPARWKALHRLAYVAAVAGALHFYLLVKADVTRPAAFAAVLAALLGHRLVAHYLKLRADAGRYRLGPTPAVAAAGRPKSWSGKLLVAQVFDETPEVRTFRLASPTGPRLPFDFLPGQYLNLALEIDGKTVRRSYTIASPPTRVGYCEITVKREAEGLASRHLHDAVRAGHLIDVRAPAGRFTYTGAESDSVVLVAAGVGITPLMAKVRYLTDLSWPGDIFLVFSVKTERDIVFRDEIDALRRRHPNLHVTVTLTREAAAGWGGKRGRVTAELLARAVPGLAGRRVHLCGPTEMTDPTIGLLRGLGVADGMIHVESFVSPSRAAAAPGPAAEAGPATGDDPDADAGAATVTFARSGAALPAPAGLTVLDLAESAGVAINYDCRSGICGQCKVPLLSGRVAMEAEDALTPADRAAGVILSCQARCVGAVVVDV